MGNTFKLGNYVNAIFQDASNNVGIGAAPSGSYKLEVTGTAKVSSTLLVGSTVTINGASATTSLNVIGSGANGILLDQDTASAGASSRLFFKMNTQTYAMLADSNGLNFLSGATAGSSTGSPKMTITSAGNVGIGTSNPSQKLEVYAGNSDGVKINATDVPSLFFYLQSGTQKNWGIATTNQAAGDFGIYQSNSNGGNPITAGTARLYINSSGAVTIAGSLSKGSGSFRIDHPLESLTSTHQLVHSFIEGPKADLIYRGKLTLLNGKAQANIDEVSTMTEGTFEALCREVQCFTTNETGWDLVKGKVIGNIIYIESQNPNSTDEISWMVIGERKDKHMMDTEWTDDNGKVIVEPLKPIEPTMPTEPII